ncbi:MAG: VWA domain-containing protein [Acidimicrobiales bacterium]
MTIDSPPPAVELAVDVGDDEPSDGDSDDDGDGDTQVLRFSRVEILTSKDFSECSQDELDELTQLMSTLRFSTYRRRSRRHVPSGRSGSLPDVRRTVRLAMKHQGEPIQRAFTEPAEKPRRLVLLLDVSGSMESYSRALIRFVHAAVVARNRVEAFAFGTRLTRVTRELSNRDPDAALRAATPTIADWSGGTRLGEVIKEFNDKWGIRGMARGAVVVVLSDGWDRGDADLLGEQMERLHRVTHRLIWVNPLRASPGYEPLAAGMAAALPHVDDFVSGHSFSTMVDLAAILRGER